MNDINDIINLMLNKEEFQKSLNYENTIKIDGKQRTAADFLEDEMRNYITKRYNEIKGPISARCIEDFSYDDIFFDVKTRNIGKKFSMPNLISFNRLFKNIKLEKRNNDKIKDLLYIFIDYKEVDKLYEIDNIKVSSYININPKYLDFGNLGTGQLQIKGYKKQDDFFIESTKSKFFELITKRYISFCVDLLRKTFERLILASEDTGLSETDKINLNKHNKRINDWLSQKEIKR